MSLIDKIFKSKLKNSSAEYSQNVWLNIEDELFPQKSNKYTGFWLLFFGVLFMAPVILFKDLDTRNEKLNTKQEDPSNHFNNQLKKSALQNQANSDQKNYSSAHTNTFKEETNRTLELAKKVPLADTENSNSQSRATPQSSSTSKSNFKTKSIAAITATPPARNTLHNVNQSILNNDYKPPLRKSVVFKNFEQIDEIPKSAKSKNNTTAPANENLDISSMAMDATNLSDRFIDIQELNESNTEYLFFQRDYLPRIKPDPCDETAYPLNRWYSEFFMSTGFAPKSISAKMSELDYFARLKSDSESIGLSYVAGFNIGYQLDNGLLFESGFEYDQFNYSFNYIDPEQVSNTTVITIDTIFTPTGDTIPTADTTYIEQVDPIRAKNKHRLIEIPLLVGMEFYLTRKLSLAVKTGISLNLYSQSEGKMVNTNRGVIEYLDDGGNQNEYYKSNFGIAIPLNTQLYFKATNEIDLFVKGGIKYYPKSITLDEFQLNEKLLLTQLGMGIRVKI